MNLHTQMDAYSRYLVVHLLRSTKLTKLKKALNSTIQTHRSPDHIWSDGGPSYNSHEWKRWDRDWEVKPKRTTSAHPRQTAW